MRVIYNEGRVAGLSAYELYVRQQLADGKDPDELMSEAEWADSTTGKGGSLILRVPAGTAAGYKDFSLPMNTSLCGCTPLYGTLFEGEVTLDSTGRWATHVVDNGRLIRNDNEVAPSTPGLPANVPTKNNPNKITPTYTYQCVEYMKISSALYVQPGEWVPRDPLEGKGLKPNFTLPGFIRLAFTEAVEHDFYIMISGFLPISLVEGYITEEDPTADYIDGEFLGPMKFPWASKVQLMITTDSLKGYLDWYLDATLTTAEYQALPVKENKFYFTRKPPQ